MPRPLAETSDIAAQRQALRRSVDEQAHARGEEAAQAVLRLVDRELDRSSGFGRWLSEQECDELHLTALRGFLEGLRKDLVDSAGLDHGVTQRLAGDVFGVEQQGAAEAGQTPAAQQAIDEAYDALLALGIAGGEPSDELASHLGDYVVQLVAAAARHDQGDELLIESRLLRNVLLRLVVRMLALPEIGLACADAALAEGRAAFEQRLIDAERVSNEESRRAIDRARHTARHQGDGP